MNRSSGTSSFSCFLSSRSEQETQAGDLFRGQLTAGATRSSKRPRPIAGRGGFGTRADRSLPALTKNRKTCRQTAQ